MKKTDSDWDGIRKSIGPGLIMAVAAIGVSHLVQSTRAGAEYGLALIWFVILANLFKYPFLEFGPRYAIATGENLVQGYKKLGNWAIWIFIIFTVGTVFAIHAAVTVVTASLAPQLTGIDFSVQVWSVLILIVCFLMLIRGKYSVLDGAVKLLMVILAISTIVALAAAFFKGHTVDSSIASPEIWTVGGIAFLIALMGWMPIPIDAAVWHSVWTLERQKQTGYKSKLKESLFDFNLGYIGAALFAVCFLVLGAIIMFGSGQSFAESAPAFSQQLIQLYTASLGEWAYFVIVVCAFTTMFSTTFTVTETYPRIFNEIIGVYRESYSDTDKQKYYPYLLGATSVVSLTFLFLMGDRFRFMIDLAATLSFLIAPILAYINYRLIFHPDIAPVYRPPLWLKWLAISGIVFLAAFSLFYIYFLIRF